MAYRANLASSYWRQQQYARAEAIGREITVLPEPQVVGALGAALAVMP